MDTKTGARERLDGARNSLIELSHRIHANPELGFEEEQASTWLSESLTAAGFSVERGVYDLPTAFVARAGSGPLHIAILAEYDALPGIGHACGHNLIAAMAVGAAIAAARVADDVGLTVSVIGTPAEEVGDGGGKILLLERGAFAGVHAAMMVHPSPFDVVEPPVIAASTFDVHYTGKEAHASAFPELGINAADALTIAQTAIGLLRQHIRPTDRVHGIITKGGDAPNIIPAHTAARYMVRSETLADLEEINTKVHRCFEAGALATGSTLEIIGGRKPYAEMRHDAALAAAYRRNAEALGRAFPDFGAELQRAAGSSDMGNVSHVLPSLQPMIGINSMPAMNHQPEFTAYCVTEFADKAIFDGALAMAWTAIDIAADARVRERLMKAKAASDPHDSAGGLWYGAISFAGQQYRIVLRLEQQDLRLAGTMNSLDQGTGDLPLEEGTLTDGTLRFRIGSIGGAFEGTLEGPRLHGSWRQRGFAVPLELARVEQIPQPN
jgi:amidohydrolase